MLPAGTTGSVCHSGRLTQTNVIQSVSEESHTGCARTHGNTPMLQRALLRGRSFVGVSPLLWMTVLVFGPSLDDTEKENTNKCHSERVPVL